MKPPDSRPNAFDIVKKVGVALPHVEATTRYDGSPVLKVAGVFMAGLASHSSAEPNTPSPRMNTKFGMRGIGPMPAPGGTAIVKK